MSNLKNWVSLSCKHATEIVEKKQITPLKLVEKIQLKLHLSFCEVCKSYQKQSEFINNFLKTNNSLKDNLFIKNEELKSTIISSLKEEQS